MKYPSIYLPLFKLISIPASIDTTGTCSDAPCEHAQFQWWNIGVEYRKKFPPATERSGWSVLHAYVIDTYMYGSMCDSKHVTYIYIRTVGGVRPQQFYLV